MSYPNSASDPPDKKQKVGLCLLLLFFIAFGAWVEVRGAMLHTRKTDAGVYFRAAWAVRTGNDMYYVTDDRGWHYIYPPLFAILMTPLADPPADRYRGGYMAYEASLGIWVYGDNLNGFLGNSHSCKGIGRYFCRFISKRATAFLPAMVCIAGHACSDPVARHRAGADARTG